MKPVAVTGIGVISPVGRGAQASFAALLAGRSGVRRLEAPFAPRLVTRIAAPVDFDAAAAFPAPKLRMLDRVSQLALVACEEALAQANGALRSADPTRIGVSMGVGVGGPQATDDGYRTLYADGSDRLKPFSVLMAMTNAPAAWIAQDHGLRGPSLTYSTACSSSSIAIGEAARCIARGEADVMIAGGAEAPLTLGLMKAWEALRTLASEDPRDPSASCKPFSKNRSGLVLGEGAAMVVLESPEHAARRGATTIAELVGYGSATDVAHLTRPSVEGQARTMQLALDDAGLDPGAIGYVNAHGTATPANDSVETAAIRSVFGAHANALAVSSTKSMHGHLLGAAGALEFAICVMALQQGRVPPTMHGDAPDPECDLDYVREGARAMPGLRAAMSNSFAFGGTNAVLVVRRPG